MFLKCSIGYTAVMTREDLLRLIARAVRRSFTFASEMQALGAADTVLRDLKAVGIRILAPRELRPNRSRTGDSSEGVDRAGDPLQGEEEAERGRGTRKEQHRR
jgi:hypothetical protein